MKVLQINSVYGYGSTGRIVSMLHKSFLSYGIDSYVIFSRESAILDKFNNTNIDKNVFKISNKFEFISHVFKAVIFDKHGLYSKKNTLRIIDKILEINPDIIHLHNIHGFYLNYEIFFEFLKKINKKVIWTLHDCWSFTSSLSHYEYSNNYVWSDGFVLCGLRNVYPYRLLKNDKDNCLRKRNAFNLENLTIVTPSNWLKDEVNKSFLNKNNIVVINNVIDYSIFKPNIYKEFKIKYDLCDKKIILGVSSIFTKQKGFYEYIKLSKLLSDKYIIILIGVNDKQIKKLPKNIIGIKRTNNVQELVDFYSNSDVFINLTLEDTYPSVNLEARACGLNVISYKTGGSSETSNYVVDKYNLNEIVRILDEEDLKKEVFINNKNMSEEYLKVYKKSY